MFARFFIDRPIFACVISVVIVILGVLSYISLPMALFPTISPPTIYVRASYPGASPETVAETVISRLQDLGVSRDRILTISVPEDKEALIHQFLDVNSLQRAEEDRRKGMVSHA